MSERDVTKDPFAAHEVLDRALIVCEMFDKFVTEHPFVVATTELNDAALKLAVQLASFYQLAGKYALDGD